jgi:hypothetical protein
MYGSCAISPGHLSLEQFDFLAFGVLPLMEADGGEAKIALRDEGNYVGQWC